MSLDERTILSEDQSNIQALALTQTSTLSQSTGSLARISQDTSAQSAAAGDLAAFFHSFRRHWIAALFLGLLCAAILAPAVYMGVGSWYTASALLRVNYQEKSMLPTNAPIYEPEYEIFKNTQLQLMQSRFVLNSALHKPEGNPISRLAIIKKQKDAVTWLMKNLSVSFPNKAEVMEVRLTTYDPEEAAQIVTAVMDAYMTEVVDYERAQRGERLNELDRVFGDKEQEVRSQRSRLKELAENLGTAETDALNLKQKLTIEELATFRNQLVSREFDLGRLKSELASRRAELDAIQNTDISDMECEFFAQQDPILRNIMQEIMWRKVDSEYTSTALVPGSKSNRFADKYQGELERFESDYRARIDSIKEEIRHKRINDVEKEIKRVQAQIDIADKQQKNNESEVVRLRKQAEQIGSSSVDVEMLRTDIENLKRSLTSITNEREKLKVDMKSDSRVQLLQKKAEVPEMPSNGPIRIAFTVMAALFGLCVPAAGLTLWDTKYQRINSSKEVNERLGIPVIGSLPIIPARVLRHLGAPSKRNQLWQIRLTESVDGITARLLRRAELEQRRVVMITSAVSGEGKTTLAAQLAMSLARTGRRTVLVDFDLRQPSFDEALGLERSPGVSEILRNESDLASAIQSTSTDNLSVITAGRWNRTALSALANGAAYSLFKELRDDFEFVVVDTSPILPIADARFVSQYVDSVVLCVFRDKSESPRIRAACDILEAFGVQSVEAVVAGTSESDSGRSGYYRSSVPA
jgi:polysaccharide biosynthesis transport protein